MTDSLVDAARRVELPATVHYSSPYPGYRVHLAYHDASDDDADPICGRVPVSAESSEPEPPDRDFIVMAVSGQNGAGRGYCTRCATAWLRRVVGSNS